MMVHHLLYYTPGRVDRRPRGCLGGDFLGGRGEEHPDGQLRRALAAGAARASTASTTSTAAGTAPEWTLTAMVMNHYKQTEALLRAHPHLVHDRARTQLYPVDDRRLPPPRQRHGLRRPGRRQAGLGRTSTARPGRCRSARASSAARSHHHGGATHQTLVERDLRAHAGRRQGLLRRARPPVQHDPPDPARAGADRQRHVRDRPGDPDQRRARCSSAPPYHSDVDAARRGDGLLGAAARARRQPSPPCAPMPTDLREVTKPARYDQHGAVRLRPRGAAAGQADRQVEGLHRRRRARSATGASSRRC